MDFLKSNKRRTVNNKEIEIITFGKSRCRMMMIIHGKPYMIKKIFALV